MNPTVLRCLALFAVALTFGCGAVEEDEAAPPVAATDSTRFALTSSCTPYAPSTGLFINTTNMLNVPSSPVTVGNYQIHRTTSAVVVTNAGSGATVFSRSINSSDITTYIFFPSSNPRFLVLDVHTNGPTTYVYNPAAADLSKYAGTPLSGVSLSRMQQTYFTPPQFRIFPSQGNGLAFFAYFGTSDTVNGTIQFPTIYRSDSVAELCSASNFTPQVQQEAQITSTEKAEIIDNTAVGPVASCGLPRGSLTITPSTQDFGSTSPTGTVQKSYTFGNSGNDCLTISSVGSSAHFTPVGFSAFALDPGQSNPVNVAFTPNGAVGSFSEALSVTRNPARGVSSMTATGVTCSDYGTVTSCGACGRTCAGAPNATPVCTNNTCGTQCNAGYTKCGDSCVSTSSDVYNCGGCGNTCPGASNGYATCSGGVCGCTVTPSPTNPAACGTCGNVCSAPTNGIATCSNSSCGFTCNAGYGVCGGACWSTGPIPSGYGVCSSDCGCGTGPEYYCRQGANDCLPALLLSKTYSFSQTVSYSGTSATTGSEGAFVPVTGATGTITPYSSRNVLLHFDFHLYYPSGPSGMNVDAIFKIDGAEVARRRFGQYDNVFEAQVYVSSGSHTLSVEARSVLMYGPPINVTISSYNGSASTLKATVVRDRI